MPKKEFPLSLDPVAGTMGEVLERKKDAQIFLLINHTLES
jgi:hypothetical protein